MYWGRNTKSRYFTRVLAYLILLAGNEKQQAFHSGNPSIWTLSLNMLPEGRKRFLNWDLLIGLRVRQYYNF